MPYNSTVNSLFSYGAGQPGGAGWPTISPSTPKPNLLSSPSNPYTDKIPALQND